MINTEDLAFGLYLEHRDRTGHDYAANSEQARARCVGCMVCIYVAKAMRQAEADSYHAQVVAPSEMEMMIDTLAQRVEDAGVTPDERAGLGAP